MTGFYRRAILAFNGLSSLQKHLDDLVLRCFLKEGVIGIIIISLAWQNIADVIE